MIYILDAHNIMFKLYDEINFSEHENVRNDFIRKISNTTISKNNKVIIVFDGKSYSQTYKNKNLQIIYSSSTGQKADGVIKQLSEKYEQKKVTVVSSDISIKKYVRQGGLKVMPSKIFVEKYLKNHISTKKNNTQKNEELNSKDIEYWKKIFSEK